MQSQIGVIGLAVMGANLARNIASRKIHCSIYNRSQEKTDKLIQEHGTEFLHPSTSLEQFINSLETPRKILIMVKSGAPIDAVIKQLTPLLQKGDIIIDGGNSNYHDTARRQKELTKDNIHFIGMGVSGGEEGALNGPSMMPGGNQEAYEKIAPILETSAANDSKDGKCVTYIGPGSSGHFVKMVHNGIEYGIMQIIAEIYDILRKIPQLSNSELAEIFTKWSREENSKSFLVEITAKIFQHEEKEKLIDKIKDQAKQKGTGKWTTFAAMNYGVSTPTINASVDARIISGDQENRSKNIPLETPATPAQSSKEEIIEMAKSTLDAATICSYNQGFNLIKKASEEYNWNLNLSEIARIWEGGCIIRSDMLTLWSQAFSDNPPEAQKASSTILTNFQNNKQLHWRQLIKLAIDHAVPTPTLSASLAYYDALAAEKLPQNLTQAQRDFFGAHTYERVDQEGTFHTDWE